MVGWPHRLNGHEFEQTLGDGERQGTLACCSPRGCKESDTTEPLNNSTCLHGASCLFSQYQGTLSVWWVVFVHSVQHQASLGSIYYPITLSAK